MSTQADGTWKVAGIKGGRYRIRAWRPPDLSLLTPQILLVGATDNPSVTLALMAYNGQSVVAAVAPTPPQVGQVTTLVVQATQQAVGGDGVVRAGPLVGSNVLVLAAGNVVLTGTNPGPTDAGGRLALLLTCATAGPVGLSASLDGLTTFPLTIPDCVPAAVTAPPNTSHSNADGAGGPHHHGQTADIDGAVTRVDAGRVTTMRVPPARLVGDSARTDPPMAETSSATMARPRPVPTWRAG